MNAVLEHAEERVLELVARDKPTSGANGASAFLNRLLSEQGQLTAVDRFSRLHDQDGLSTGQKVYRKLLPGRAPGPGEQYAFEVNLDKCSGCKACVSACHSLNGLEEEETWRTVGLLVDPLRGGGDQTPYLQHITTACHHCIDPACLTGCPVLAYEKDPVTGIVRHLDDQCMGCSYCVMKCPYEVPKYSTRLGIVRKCDMCTNRLSVGEAPACVQGCPNEAITISVVKQSEIVDLATSHLNGSKVWLPDSPEPHMTIPTTRFVSDREVSKMARAADTDRLRLDNPHWPLVLMLVLTQAAAGIFLLGASGRLAGFSVDVRASSAAGFIMLCAGLSASVMHLGRPSKAWRAFLGWRQSWLSREVIALNVFAGIALLFTVSALASEWPSGLWRDACSALVAGSGVLGVFTSVMVYVDVQRPFWCAGRVFAQFYGTTLLLGLSIAVVLLVWLKGLDPIAQSAALGALVLNIALFSWRRLELRFALRDETRPIHFNARVISELLPRTRALGSTLCVASSMLWVAVFVDFLSAASLWAMLAALAAFVSEMNERYVFFTASGSKRMPGGIGS